jgi:hypothetical protein
MGTVQEIIMDKYIKDHLCGWDKIIGRADYQIYKTKTLTDS